LTTLAGAGQISRFVDGVRHRGRVGRQRLVALVECGIDRVVRIVFPRSAPPDVRMREPDIGQHAFIQPGRVVGAQASHVGVRERDVGQRLVLHARDAFVRGAPNPNRFGDDADMLVWMAFDEGELRGKDPAGVATEFRDVGQSHIAGRIPQPCAQPRQSVSRHRDQHRLPPVQPFGYEAHQAIDVLALRPIEERQMLISHTRVCCASHVDGLVPRQCFLGWSPR
jgi:hypothetical protein